jgi:hypothetical protein
MPQAHVTFRFTFRPQSYLVIFPSRIHMHPTLGIFMH